MSWGIGTQTDVGYGDADSWGGPVNGVDVMEHISGVKRAKHANMSSDAYMFGIIIVALALLWLLGGVVFKSARL
jgi:hypothetical protein